MTPLCPCDAATLKRRRCPVVALNRGLPCLVVALPGHCAHPPSRLSPRLALSSRLTSHCSALPPRPGSSCPACCHLVSTLSAAPAVCPPCCPPSCPIGSPAVALPPPTAIALPGGRPARSQLCRRPAVGIILLLPFPAGALLPSPGCYHPAASPGRPTIAALRCLATAALSCYVTTHIPWPPVHLHSC